jgi:SecD/SecF fusion protein
VTGGQDAGSAPRVSQDASRQARRAGRVVRPEGGARDGWFALGGEPALTNADIKRARGDVIDAMTKEPIVALELTAGGQKAFTELTRRLSGRGAANATPGSGLESVQHFVIVIDDRIASVPFIDFRQNPEGIDGATGMQISGGLTKKTARQLAALLSAGPLAGPLQPAGQAP